jgi:hypothetical protein
MIDIYNRPRQSLEALSRSYPGVWKDVEAVRENRKGFGDWPTWCYMPIALALKIICKGRPPRDVIQYKHSTFLAALAAWRATQGIYRFDPHTFDALWNTSVTGDIPIEVLYCLPEWCVFIPTPDRVWEGNRLNGFFAHLDRNHEMRRTELRLLLDISRPDGRYDITAMPIILGKSVTESLAATLEWSAQPDPLATPMSAEERAMAMKEVPSLISLVLYLCSENAEINESGGSRFPTYPEARKTKKGVRLFAPDRPTHWEVGYRLGAALKRASTVHHPSDGTHARPRPHIRRAHWHSYWVGKLGEGRKVLLKWLPPIAVNVLSVHDLTATVRDVGHVSVTHTTG